MRDILFSYIQSIMRIWSLRGTIPEYLSNETFDRCKRSTLLQVAFL